MNGSRTEPQQILTRLSQAGSVLRRLIAEDLPSIGTEPAVIEPLTAAADAIGGIQRELRRREPGARSGPNPKMGPQDEEDARRMIARGDDIEDVAAHFGVHRTTLWKHIGPAGTRSPLTVEQVRQIKARPPGETHVAVAREFGVSPATIMRIRLGQTWRDVAAEPPAATSQRGTK